ncbi:MAG TPA: ABC transporter permease, partial [Acidimicrobiales bacterium]|nr:ABC transporter permease [Acidimicrobiales bacterium]
ATHTAAAMQRIRRQPRQADRDPVGRARKRRIIELSLGITFPVALLVLWQIAGTQGWISRFNYPPPSDIAKEINRSFRANPKGNWWIDVYWSAERMLFGYMWGVFIGVFLGVTMGMNRLLRATLEPTLNALYTVPKIALIGVFLVTLGFTNRPVIAIVTITVFFFVWIQTMAAVMAVSENYREAAASFGSNRWQMFRHVMLPASLPQIFVGLRVAAGVAVLTIIGVEFVFAPGQKGIGYRIVNARQTLDPKQAYVGLFVAAVFGVIFVTVIKFLDWLLLPWARDDNSLD